MVMEVLHQKPLTINHHKELVAKPIPTDAGDSTAISMSESADQVTVSRINFTRGILPEFFIPSPIQPFDLSFHPNHGYWLAMIAALTYGIPAEITKVGDQILNMNETRIFEDAISNTRAIALVHPKYLIISWRGTEGEENVPFFFTLLFLFLFFYSRHVIYFSLCEVEHQHELFDDRVTERDCEFSSSELRS